MVTPRQAAWISTVIVVVGGAAAVLAVRDLQMPLSEVLPWVVIFLILCPAYAWTAVDPVTHRAAISAHNGFVGIAVGLFVVVTILQWNVNGQPFPNWATAIGAITALICYGYVVVLGLGNLWRWLFSGDEPPPRCSS